VNALLPERKLRGLIIDENGWVKKGLKAQLYRQMTDEQMYEKIININIKRQIDVDNAYDRQNSNLSK
jgi:hypothetical protein